MIFIIESLNEYSFIQVNSDFINVPLTPQCKNSWISYQDLGFSYKIVLPLEFLDKILESLTSSKKSWIFCQDSYQEIREVKILISSKFRAISKIVELGLFTVILGHVMGKLWKNQ